MKSFIDKKVLRYLVVGITAFLVDFLLFVLLNEFTSIPIFYSNAMALVAGFLISFFGNRMLVFGVDKSVKMKHAPHKQLFLYVILLVVNTILSYFVIKLLRVIGVDVAMGKIAAMVLIVFWNYISYKKIIFKQS